MATASPKERLKQAGELIRRTGEKIRKPSDVEIVDRLRKNGIEDYVSVACSVTASIEDMWLDLRDQGEINHYRATHEHSLAGIAEGIWIATGRIPLMHMQNSGLPNAMDGIISFVEVYKPPALMLVTWRGIGEDSEPHVEIGERMRELTRATFKKGERKQIFGEPAQRGALSWVEKATTAAKDGKRAMIRLAQNNFDVTRKPIRRVESGEIYSVEKYEAQKSYEEELMYSKGTLSSPIAYDVVITRDEAIERIVKEHPHAAILFANGYTARAAQERADRLGNFYNVGYMGGTLALGWAITINNPNIEVVVVDGDQNAEMSCMKDSLFNRYPKNFFYYILNNGAGSSVGTADSEPLTPTYYRLARVIPTFADEYGSFDYPRVKGRGAYFSQDDPKRATYFDQDEVQYMADKVGPLPIHLMRFKEWVEQQTHRNKAQKALDPFDFRLQL